MSQTMGAVMRPSSICDDRPSNQQTVARLLGSRHLLIHPALSRPYVYSSLAVTALILALWCRPVLGLGSIPVHQLLIG